MAVHGLPRLPVCETDLLTVRGKQTERNYEMYKLRRMTGESFLEQCLFCYPKRPGTVIVLLVITILGFFMTIGTFAKSGVANDCPLSLTQITQKIKSAEERFTVYRCEWVVARFEPVHPK